MLAGGGIKNTKQVENILNSGADRVFLNTAALDNPSIIDEIVKKYGSSTLVVSIIRDGLMMGSCVTFCSFLIMGYC